MLKERLRGLLRVKNTDTNSGITAFQRFCIGAHADQKGSEKKAYKNVNFNKSQEIAFCNQNDLRINLFHDTR